jgi:hypothetical protein
VSAQSAAPGTGIPGERLIEGVGCDSNSLNAVFNAICGEAKSYDGLQATMRGARPRLLPESVDFLLGKLICSRVVRLSDDGRWAVRP